MQSPLTDMKPPTHPQNRNEEPPQSLIPNRGIFELTPREWDVLLHINDDLTNAEIADRLCLTTKSVVNYRNRIGSKLDLQGARKLARFVRKHQDELRQWHELLTAKYPPPLRFSYIRACWGILFGQFGYLKITN